MVRGDGICIYFQNNKHLIQLSHCAFLKRGLEIEQCLHDVPKRINSGWQILRGGAPFWAPDRAQLNPTYYPNLTETKEAQYNVEGP